MAATLVPWDEMKTGKNEQDIVIFNHIPKTAGTSLSYLLLSRFSYVYGDREIPANIKRGEKEGGHLFRGHNAAEAYHLLDSSVRACLITILREPLARCISSYFFSCTIGQIKPSRNSLIEFILEPPMYVSTNCLTRYLGNGDIDLAREKLFCGYGFFGLQEEFALSIQGLAHIFNWDSPIRYTSRNKSNKEEYDLPDAIKDCFYEKNSDDVALYMEAVGEFSRRAKVFRDCIEFESDEAEGGDSSVEIATDYRTQPLEAIINDCYAQKLTPQKLLPARLEAWARGKYLRSMICGVSGGFLLGALDIYEAYFGRCYQRSLSIATYLCFFQVFPEEAQLVTYRRQKANYLSYACLSYVNLYPGRTLSEPYTTAIQTYCDVGELYPYFDWCCEQEDERYLEQYLSLATPDNVTLPDERARFHARLALWYESRQKWGKALIHARSAVTAMPGHITGGLVLLRCERKCRDYQMGKDTLERLLRIAPHSKNCDALLGEWVFYAAISGDGSITASQHISFTAVTDEYGYQPNEEFKSLDQDEVIGVYSLGDPLLGQWFLQAAPAALKEKLLFFNTSSNGEHAPDAFSCQMAVDTKTMQAAILLIDSLPVNTTEIIVLLGLLGFSPKRLFFYSPNVARYHTFSLLEHTRFNDVLHTICSSHSIAVWGKGEFYKTSVEPLLRLCNAKHKVQFFIESRGAQSSIEEAIPTLTPENVDSHAVDAIIVGTTAYEQIAKEADALGLKRLLFI